MSADKFNVSAGIICISILIYPTNIVVFNFKDKYSGRMSHSEFFHIIFYLSCI